MIDENFCKEIERRIGWALPNFEEKRINTFCTDGIVFNPNDKCFSKKFVNDKRYVMMDMYTCSAPQRVDLILMFGQKALSRYARGLDITPCIPAELDETNMDIDFEKAQLIIQLD